jgi:uncharacterized membrane protein (UPF0182 family)
VAMRPPIPALALSRRAKIILSVIGILIVVLIIGNSLVGIYVDWLWFGEVRFRGVFSAIIGTRAALFGIFGLLMALMIGGNLVIAYLIRPPFRPLSAEQQNLERYRVSLEPRKRLVLALVMVISFLGAGLAAQGNWRTWMLWRFGGSFGVKDPQFGRDLSFFAWDYPVYRLMLGFGFTAIFFSLVFAIAVHYLYGAIRLQTPGPKITLSARRHITILIFLFIVFKAIAYWLDRYGLVYSNRGRVTGASYTDVNASLPAKTILFWIAVIIAIAVLASMWLKSARLPAIGFGVLLVLSILISGIYPAAVQQFSVKPNASDKEAVYIKRNIEATRNAYDIQTDTAGGSVKYVTNYATTNEASKSALVPSNTTISNIRILDPNIIEPTFTQQQQIKNQYGFPDKLDIDRYTVDGVTRDYVVAIRELKADNLRGDQTNWINQHTVYTHGYGFVAAQANKPVNSKDEFAEGDIPVKGDVVKIDTPQVYFGELSTDYSIVGASGSREYDGSDSTSHYEGKGGVPLGNFFNRLAFAVDYKQTNFLLNDAVSAKGAKIIFNKDPRERILKVAPFLKVDGDPYPIVVNGRLVWMVDGYTTMANYPYSERQSLSSLTTDSLTTTNRTASQPDSDINYIRNSVKATVDAYDGTIHLYQWNDQDPVLKAWMKAFPNLVQPKSEMPQDVLAHVRYPEDLFEVQRALLAKYHVDDPVTFYNVRDQWSVPTDPTATAGDQPPYYLVADKPQGNGTTSQFQLTSPMKVNNRDNLAAYITVDSDPGPNYGQMTVFKLPTSSAIQGPTQVFNRFSSEPAISRDISLLSQGGSTILHGNLLTLPVGNTFLYVEPLYVARSGAGFPLLQAILVAYGDQIGYGSSVSDALTHLSPVGQVPPLRTSSTPGGTLPTSSPSASPSTPPKTSPAPTPSTTPPASGGADAVLRQLDAAFTELQNAYKSGDLARIGDAEAKVQRLTKQYLSLRGSPTPTPSATR